MTSPTERRIRVLAVVHNRILREGVRSLIEMQDDLALVDVVSTAEDGVLKFAELQPDLTLMDLDLPCEAGLESIHRIRELAADAWVIGMVVDENDDRVQRAIQAGAATVIAKHRIGKLEWRRSTGNSDAGEPLKTGGSNTPAIGMSKR